MRHPGDRGDGPGGRVNFADGVGAVIAEVHVAQRVDRKTGDCAGSSHSRRAAIAPVC